MNYYIGTIPASPELTHHGVKGMKWGVRRYQNPDGSLTAAGRKRYGDSGNIKTLNADIGEQTILKAKSKNGSEITIAQNEPTKFNKMVAAGIEAVNWDMLNFKDFDIKVNGNRVGSMELHQDSPDILNGVWLGIDRKYRGTGIATASLLSALDYAKHRDYKKFTLEVPGNSPDARHIYEKIGFVAGKQISTPDTDPMWGGLTEMRLDLSNWKSSDDWWKATQSEYAKTGKNYVHRVVNNI